MESKTVQNISLLLLAVGTAATVIYVWQSRRGGGSSQPISLRRVRQPARDSGLGKPGRSRKYFGFHGPSSAAGFGGAASPPPAIGLFRSRSVQQGQKRTSTNTGQTSSQFRPTFKPGQNGKRNRPIVLAVASGNADAY